MKKFLALLLSIMLLSTAALAEVKIGQVEYAAHGTSCFAVLTVAMDGDMLKPRIPIFEPRKRRSTKFIIYYLLFEKKSGENIMKYDFKTVEAKWQKVWEDEDTFHAEIDHSKPKFYALVEFPYPSAADAAGGDQGDQRAEDEKGSDAEDGINIPRTMFNRNGAEMQFFFQSAILTTKTIELSEKDRLYLAFSEEISEEELTGEDAAVITKGVSQQAIDFDKIDFLKGFANYGASKIVNCISSNDSEMMENVMEFFNDSYNGDTEELKT